MDKDQTRGERRDRTERHQRRVQRVEHTVAHGWRWGALVCSGVTGLGRFRKAKAFACRCRGKQKGAPKLAGSRHKADYAYRTTVMRRIWNRRLARAWRDAAAAGGEHDSALPTGPIIGRRHARTW